MPKPKQKETKELTLKDIDELFPQPEDRSFRLLVPTVPVHTITYFEMGHAETLEGWVFGGKSWGVRVDGVLEAVFENGRIPAQEHATARAFELGGVVEELGTI